MNICVFCSMHDVAPIYKAAASELGQRLAEQHHTLVWGGSDSGLMGVIANVVKENGGRMIGITFEHIKETARKDADELVVVKDIAERKKLLQERADAFILLPGGIGSLDEITEMLELKKHNFHNKPLIILNTDGFYDGFRTQLERMEREKFIARPLQEFLFFASTPEEVLSYLKRIT